MPSDLPRDAERALARRCASQGVRELAIPLGDGWMQRAGRGCWSVSSSSKVEGSGGGAGGEEGRCEVKAASGGDGGSGGGSSGGGGGSSGGGGGSSGGGGGSTTTIEMESLENSFYLMTYDQTPDAHTVKSGHYRLEVSIRTLPGHSVRETPYAAIALNWTRGRSTVTAPCFVAVALTANAWRIEQYADGVQHTLAEVRDATLKPGGAFRHVVIDVRADQLSLRVNKRPLLTQLIPPLGSTVGGGARAAATSTRASAALTGAAGLAVYKSRAQVRRFDISPLEEGATGGAASGGAGGGGGGGGGGGALVVARPPFTGGDPKLVELIEGEMLEASPNVTLAENARRTRPQAFHGRAA